MKARILILAALALIFSSVVHAQTSGGSLYPGAQTTTSRNLMALPAPSAQSVVRINTDGTNSYLDSTGVANWLGVTTDGALNAFAADPTSNGSFVTPTWISGIGISAQSWLRTVGALRHTRDKIWQIRKSGAASGKYLTILPFGDSVATEHLNDHAQSMLYRSLGWAGRTISGTEASGQWDNRNLAGGAAYITNAFSYWPTGGLTSIPSGGSWTVGINDVTYGGNSPATATYPLSKRLVDTMDIVYVKEVGAGTFGVKSSNSRTTYGVYTDVAGLTSVDTSLTSGSPTYGVSTVSLPRGLGNSIEILGVSGTVKILFVRAYDSQSNGVIIADLNQGGIRMEGSTGNTGNDGPANSASSTILSGVLTNELKPDLITWAMKDSVAGDAYGAGLSTALANFWSLWNGAYTGCDWVFVAANPSKSVDADYGTTDVLKTFCQTNGVGFYDTLTNMRNWQQVEDIGWHLNEPHLNSEGTFVQTDHFIRDLGLIDSSIEREARDVYASSITGYSDVGWRNISLANLAAGTRDRLFETRGMTISTSSSYCLGNATPMTSVGTGDFTESIWLDYTSLVNGRYIIKPGASTAYGNIDGLGFVQKFNSTTFVVSARNGSNTLDRYFAVPASTEVDLIHKVLLTVRRSSGVISLWLNDVPLQVANNDSLTGTITFGDSFNSAYFALQPSGCKIYEAAFWPSALTDAQIAGYYESASAPGSPAFVWKFTRGAGSVVQDATANNLSGTIDTRGIWSWLNPSNGAEVMTPNTTAIITFNTAGTPETIYNTSASTIASSTITLPTASADGQRLTYYTHATHTSVTMAGGTVIGAALMSLSADQTVEWVASATSGTWIRVR